MRSAAPQTGHRSPSAPTPPGPVVRAALCPSMPCASAPHVTCTLMCPGGSSLSSPFTVQPLPLSHSAPLCSGLWVYRLLIPGGALTAWPRSESPRALGAAACPMACPLPTLRKDWPAFSHRRSTSPQAPSLPPAPVASEISPSRILGNSGTPVSCQAGGSLADLKEVRCHSEPCGRLGGLGQEG